MLALSSTLPNIEAFRKTFESGSFTRAARLLGVTPQATSRSIARLEQELGVTLFRRTTRSVSPTEEARRYYARCVQALALLSMAEQELRSVKNAPEGEVRISVPTTYGHHVFLPLLGVFRERFPKIGVEVSVSNHNVNFVHEGFDLAIRMGEIRDQSLVARKLGDFPFGVYASPAYLAGHGVPSTPADLSTHSCIAFVMPSSGRVLPWSFAPSLPRFAPQGGYRASDDVLGAVTLARAGLGLVQIYDFVVRDDVTRGLLVEVLAPYRGGSRAFSLLRPKGVRPSRATRALADFVIEHARGQRGGASAPLRA
jgi:DNA-binding transcriptional LysR family regulator